MYISPEQKWDTATHPLAWLIGYKGSAIAFLKKCKQKWQSSRLGCRLHNILVLWMHESESNQQNLSLSCYLSMFCVGSAFSMQSVRTKSQDSHIPRSSLQKQLHRYCSVLPTNHCSIRWPLDGNLHQRNTQTHYWKSSFLPLFMFLFQSNIQLQNLIYLPICDISDCFNASCRPCPIQIPALLVSMIVSYVSPFPLPYPLVVFPLPVSSTIWKTETTTDLQRKLPHPPPRSAVAEWCIFWKSLNG